MKKLAILAMLLASSYLNAQVAQLYYAFTATVTGGVADTSLAPQVDALNVRLNGVLTSTTWTAQIQTSPDNATWTACGSLVSATAASSSSGGACVPAGAAYVRVLITSGGGTGSVTGALLGTCSLCQLAGGGGGAVDSVFGRTGVVVAESGDYTCAQVTGCANNVLVPVENFGAVGYTTQSAAVAGTDSTTAIQDCLNSLVGFGGQCLLQAKFYKITSALSITASSVGLAGTVYGLINTSVFTTPPISTLISTSASADMIDVSGTSTSATIAFNRFDDFTLSRSVLPTGTATGMAFNYTFGEVAQRVVVQDSVRGFYYQATGSIGPGNMDSLVVTWGYNNLTETTGSYYGFYVDSASGNQNASLWLTHDFAVTNSQPAITSYGIYENGDALNDLFVSQFQSGLVSYGAYVNYTGGGNLISCDDIHFWQNIHDQFYVNGYSINGLSLGCGASLEISGGWASSAAASTFSIALTNSTGVAVHALQASSDAGIDGVIDLVNSPGNSITGNTLGGAYATTAFYGIMADATSIGNILYPNLVRGGVSTPVYDASGTGNVAFQGTVGVGGAPVLSWPITEQSGTTYFDAVSTNNVTAQNNTWTAVTGFPGKMSFYSGSSTSNATAANHTLTNFDGTKPFSVSFWFVDNTAGASTIAVLFGTLLPSSNDVGWAVTTTQNTGVGGPYGLGFYLVNSFPTNAIQQFYFPPSSTVNIRDGNLHFGTVSYNGTQSVSGVAVTIDGVPCIPGGTSINTLTASTANAQDLVIGTNTDGSLPLTGAVGGLSIYSVALSGSAPLALFSAGPPSKTAGVTKSCTTAFTVVNGLIVACT